jgi:hypothetical protein
MSKFKPKKNKLKFSEKEDPNYKDALLFDLLIEIWERKHMYTLEQISKITVSARV